MFRRLTPTHTARASATSAASDQERVDGHRQRRAGHDGDRPPRRRCGGVHDGGHREPDEQGIDEGTLRRRRRRERGDRRPRRTPPRPRRAPLHGYDDARIGCRYLPRRVEDRCVERGGNSRCRRASATRTERQHRESVAPRRPRTASGVRARMRRSRQIVQPEMYDSSYRTRSSNFTPDRPLICQTPVTPDAPRGRRTRPPPTLHLLGSHRPRPDQLIDPSSTFKSCGTSSRLHRRSQPSDPSEPRIVFDRQLEVVLDVRGPQCQVPRRISSESVRIVRNFSISNGMPSSTDPLLTKQDRPARRRP